MRQHLPGLHHHSPEALRFAEGFYLVRVQHTRYAASQAKPFYAIRFSVLEPKESTGALIPARLYCTPRALWKLSWFLRDFGYDADLYGRDEIDEKRLLGLRGVIKLSRAQVNEGIYYNLEGFASAERWPEFPHQNVNR
jgi:hypothetical protein